MKKACPQLLWVMLFFRNKLCNIFLAPFLPNIHQMDLLADSFLTYWTNFKTFPILQNNLGFSTKIFKHNNFCRFPPFIVGFHPHTFFESMI